MKVYVYCGISGAGKSTFIAGRHPGALVCSADQYFMVDGEYRFDPSKIGEAHAWCLRTFTYLIGPDSRAGNSVSEIVVDNTNTTVAELAPYAALALAYGHELEVITIHCDPTVAHARNTHGVPLEVVQRMSEQLALRKLPPWWPQQDVPMMTGARQ